MTTLLIISIVPFAIGMMLTAALEAYAIQTPLVRVSVTGSGCSYCGGFKSATGCSHCRAPRSR